MTINQVSIVLVGAGLIGPRHAQHINERKDAELYAIIDPFHGKDLAKEYNVPLFKSVKEMIDSTNGDSSKRPDAAIIATPNQTHIPLAAELASFGIHLLIEKPLSSNPQDSKALHDYCVSKEIKVLVGHHRRFNPYVIQTKKNLGRLGSIVGFQGSWCLKKPQPYFENGLWRTDPKVGGGTLLINLIHDIDLLIYLFGPIHKVYAELLPKQRDYDVDEGASLTLRFSSGVVGNFICSDNVVSPFNFESGTGENPEIPFFATTNGFYRIFGSNGTLSFPDLNLYHQDNLSEKTWNKPILTEKLANHEDLVGIPFDLQLEHFVNVLNDIDEPFCSAIDGTNAVLSIEAVMKSIESGLPQIVAKFEDVVPNDASLRLI